jgi:hypothetical protein
VVKGDLTYNGWRIGARWALAYATGTRAERRTIRHRLARMGENYSRFVAAVWEGFDCVAGDLAAEILDGRRPRTVNPFKLRNLIERI